MGRNDSVEHHDTPVSRLGCIGLAGAVKRGWATNVAQASFGFCCVTLIATAKVIGRAVLNHVTNVGHRQHRISKHIGKIKGRLGHADGFGFLKGGNVAQLGIIDQPNIKRAFKAVEAIERL